MIRSMNKILLTFFIFISVNCYSQNYFLFHKDRPAYYSFPYQVNFYKQAGISIDSFVISGSDTLYYHYRVIDYNPFHGCVEPYDTSFLGIYSIRTSISDEDFFNQNGDTILFKNNSTV